MAQQMATFDEQVKAIDVLAGFMGNFASGLVESLQSGQKSAAEILAKYQAHYAIGINAANTARNLAMTAGDPVLEAAWRATADGLSKAALQLADSTKPALERIALHDAHITSTFAALGRYVGPAFDTYKLWDAINSGDGQKTSEATLSIVMGMAGGLLGAAVGSVVLPGLGTAIGAAFGSAICAAWAEDFNVLVFPLIQKLGALIPDGFWRNVEAALHESGSAGMAPTATALVNLLLARIDATMATNRGSPILDAAANIHSNSEAIAVINFLGRILAPDMSPLADTATPAQIRLLGNGIAALTDQSAGRLRIAIREPSLEEARSSFSVFLGIHVGSPLTITASDSASQNAIDAALAVRWADEYELWLSDQSGVSGGEASSALNFTDEYLRDRSAMIRAGIIGNVAETATVTSAIAGHSVSGPSYFKDLHSGSQVSLGATDQPSQRQQFVFGGGEDETISGYGRADHLYGGAGNDTISGLGGGDYLEGNTGADHLNGGDGNDTLIGGTGTDTYTFDAAWGRDLITDRDGLGSVQIEGGTILGFKESSQRWLIERKIVGLRAPRQASSIRASCEACR